MVDTKWKKVLMFFSLFKYAKLDVFVLVAYT